MAILDYRNDILNYILEKNVLSGDPLLLVDVGCSGGIPEMYRVLGSANIRALGLDGAREHINEINKTEPFANVHYYNYLVGIEPAESSPEELRKQLEPFRRPSCSQIAREMGQEKNNQQIPFQGDSDKFANVELITLDRFLCEQHVNEVDFIKTDTDGRDYEVLCSAGETLRSKNVLGLCVEVFFSRNRISGTTNGIIRKFSHIAELLADYGYCHTGFSPLARYCLPELPDLFAGNYFAQNTRGRLAWGNAIFFRDITDPEYEQKFANLTVSKILKTICLYVLHNLHDWAAASILHYKDRLEKSNCGLDTERMLDLLTPQVFGKEFSYREYLELFQNYPELFLPKNSQMLNAKVQELKG